MFKHLWLKPHLVLAFMVQGGNPDPALFESYPPSPQISFSGDPALGGKVISFSSPRNYDILMAPTVLIC